MSLESFMEKIAYLIDGVLVKLEKFGSVNVDGLHYRITMHDRYMTTAVERIDHGEEHLIVGYNSDLFESKAEALDWIKQDIKKRLEIY